MADVIEQAQEILDTTPLPADAEQQLRALEDKADVFEQIEFPWIWEAFNLLVQDYGEPELRNG